MFRRWAVAGVLTCGGVAFADPWPVVPVAKPAADTVYVMRTAGQNDRQVKVVREADPEDPTSLAEVKDTSSGQTFVIPGKVLAKLPKLGSPRLDQPTAEAPLPDPVPVPVAPPQSGLPSRVQTQPAELAPDNAPLTPAPMVSVSVPPLQMVRAESIPLQPAPALTPRSTDLPMIVSPVPPIGTPSSKLPVLDPWRATGETKAVIPTPPPAVAGPRLTPVPTWRAAPKATPPGVQDPWRPTGG